MNVEIGAEAVLFPEKEYINLTVQQKRKWTPSTMSSIDANLALLGLSQLLIKLPQYNTEYACNEI